ncbi:hypothetical protein NF867_08505 [Solitalea sp. MAHUQ-68]|uniref:Uncharacterized protein n=1 Tax=Solitalea agri TaxID=2953739 RepID=A0A9X2JCU0_9SPHI|nr:hypothetical protein [Solitalea agri]MCO4292899.1 hypothetical protein [Solitalea agri]
MKLVYIVKIAVLSSLFFTACNQEKTTTMGTTPAEQAKSAMIANSLRASQNAAKISANTIPVSSVPIGSPSTQNFGQSTSMNAVGGVNPPHGQLGHRCDIAVGAPLNSPVQPVSALNTVKANPSTAQVSLPATAQTISQPVTITKPGMNPPHGQPGHRCDIAVGAPLNSKPKTIAATQNSATVPVTTTSQSQPAAATVSPVVTPEGMNPPHGQPGHRCDIAVGAPLNKN